jgi:hypothetical protein
VHCGHTQLPAQLPGYTVDPHLLADMSLSLWRPAPLASLEIISLLFFVQANKTYMTPSLQKTVGPLLAGAMFSAAFVVP